ncbi:TIGR02391 family protein [Candidatus Poriferisodalis sp.]|uniref:TIGR02391 family protein n=1 Tax=Candidatus Poriferisodalis sp. TaxID=3101277 RepID=UPI003B5B23C1
MVDLNDATVIELPIDELALLVLEDLKNEWNARNYLLLLADGAGNPKGGPARAVQEAVAWLYNRGLIASDLSQSSEHAIFVTRAGHDALKLGLEHVRAIHSLNEGLHPDIERRARRQFLLGEYEQAVFVSMKAVEVRVRDLSALGDHLVGVPLMNQAFGDGGPLADPAADPGERQGRRALFAGAYAVLRNPAGHRDVNYDDVAEAAEAVAAASLLMRILDSVESSQGP